MKNDLIINGKDAYTEWGVSMGNNFIQNLLLPPPNKEYIENESRLENGKRVITSNPKINSRQITLMFDIVGKTESDYMKKFKSFVSILNAGSVNIKVPKLGNEVYKLVYLNSVSFAQNYKRTSSRLSIKFEEPNPTDRN